MSQTKNYPSGRKYLVSAREYRIDHPDFIFAASTDVLQITIEEADGTQHYLSAVLVTSVERVGLVSSVACW